MEAVKIENLMIAANAATQRNIMDVHPSGIIAVGTSNTILISDTQKVFFTLNRHSSRINAVKWIHHDEFKYSLISISDDSQFIVWNNNEIDFNWQVS